MPTGTHSGVAALPLSLRSQLKGRVAIIPTTQITIPEDHKREVSLADRKALRTSLANQGQLQPICVRPRRNGGATSYELVFGAHRLMAFRELLAEAEQGTDTDEIGRWQMINAIEVTDKIQDYQVSMMTIAENLFRAELTADERAASITEYAGHLKILDAARDEGEKEIESAKDRQIESAKETNKKKARSLQPATTGKSKLRIAQDDTKTKKTVQKKTAEDLSVDTSTVSRAKAKVKDLIDEDIDLEKDSGEEIVRKAKKAKVKAAEKKSTPKEKKPVKPAVFDAVKGNEGILKNNTPDLFKLYSRLCGEYSRNELEPLGALLTLYAKAK